MTTPQPQHAIDAAITQEDRELARSLVRPFLDMQGYDAIQSAQRACQIIANHRAAHPDPELARLREELHIRNAELKTVCEYKDEYAKIAKRNEDKNTQLRARVAELESQLNDAREYGARMQRERDDRKKLAETWESTATQHLADAIRLENRLNALRLVCGTTDANKFETALDRANAKIKELEARILADNKAYGCELRDPNGTIWEYAETLKKRISELELQTFDIKALEADKARLDAGLTKLYDELEGYEDGAPDAGPKSQLANACLPTIRSLLAIVRAAIDTARTAQPAANTGDNHRTEDKL